MNRVLLSAIVLACIVHVAAAQIPKTFSYQGVLKEDGGTVADGDYEITFRLYDDLTGGTLLWEEMQTVSVSGGIINAILGSVTSLDLPFDGPYWLGISIGGEGELTPRTELASTPYSLNARSVEDRAITTEKLADRAVTRAKIDTGQVVTSLNALTDDVILAPGENIVIVEQGDSIIISSPGGGGGSCVTLDEAYDCPAPGAGRTITADSGPVNIAGTDGLMVTATLLDNAILATHAGAGDAIVSGHSGTGSAISADNSGAGAAIAASISVAGNASDAVEVVTSGTGDGVDVHLSNPANAADGVHSVTDGTGRAVYGLSGPDPASGNPATGGVAGESTDLVGTSGYSENAHGVDGGSKNSNGVYGTMAKTGTFAQGLPFLVSGVKGVSAEVATVDNFAVIGDARGYGVGVLGLGGPEHGHGVMGIAGGDGDGPSTTTAVRGVTSEGAWPPPHWTLGDATGKVQVGVLGQAYQRVSIWGESWESFGSVGTTGDQLGMVDLPGEAAGVFGHGSQSSANGVHGLSTSGLADDAGVVAEGHGAAAPGVPEAAALEIRNGAIRVSGGARPAGTIDVPTPNVPIVSCSFDCPDCTHSHVIGWHIDVPLPNDLIVAESIILLTVEGSFAPPGSQYTVQLLAKEPGVAMIRVALMGDYSGQCVCPQGEVKVHYQIINPFPDGE